MATALACIGAAWLWGLCGWIETDVEAWGRIVTTQRLVPIEVSEKAVLRTIDVREGQHVAAGQRLAEIEMPVRALGRAGRPAGPVRRPIIAPAAGVVRQVASVSPGALVTPAQALMVLAPDGVAIAAEVVVPAEFIGMLREGQVVPIRIDTFRYIHVPTLQARLQYVEAKAVADARIGHGHRAMLLLRDDTIDIDGQRLALIPGTPVSTKLQTGRRHPFDYALGRLHALLKR